MKQQTSTRSNGLSKLKISVMKRWLKSCHSGENRHIGFGTSSRKFMDWGLANSQNTMGFMGYMRRKPIGKTHYTLLRERYTECLGLVLDVGDSPKNILGSVDSKKLHSSITLFLEADPKSDLLNGALERLFFGELDNKTIEILTEH